MVRTWALLEHFREHNCSEAAWNKRNQKIDGDDSFLTIPRRGNSQAIVDALSPSTGTTVMCVTTFQKTDQRARNVLYYALFMPFAVQIAK